MNIFIAVVISPPRIPEIGTRLLIKERKEKKRKKNSYLSVPFHLFPSLFGRSFVVDRVSTTSGERNFIRVTMDRDRSCNLRSLFFFFNNIPFSLYERLLAKDNKVILPSSRFPPPVFFSPRPERIVPSPLLTPP